MGLFSGRDETTVGTQIQRVIDDKLIPNSMQNGMVRSIIDKETNASDAVMDSLINGLATKADRYYEYGRDKYMYGLPAANSYSSVTGKDVVLAALQSDVGPVSSVSYYKLGPANMIHIGWLTLVRDYAYDSSANTFKVNGQVVYLSNIQPVIIQSNFDILQSNSMDVFGDPPNAGPTPENLSNSNLLEQPVFIVDPGASADYIKVSYCWEAMIEKVVEGVTVTSKELKKGTITLGITGIDTGASYFQIRYMQNGKAGYWMYRLNSGEKPAVEAIFNSAPTLAGTYFPWAYLRYDKKQSSMDTSSEEYKQNTKLLKTLGINYADMNKNINDNPDIKDVEQAIVMMGVPAITENEVERHYLFDFFDELYVSTQVTGGSTSISNEVEIKRKLGQDINASTITFRDSRFKMALSYSNIDKRRVSGNIGKIGHHDSGSNISSTTHKVIDVLGLNLDWNTNTPTHLYRRQVSLNVYEELIITDLKMKYWIFGDYTTTTDDVDDILMIPIDYAITKSYDMFMKEELYARSLFYVFNSRVVTHLKWYQTGVFKAILIIAAIVITLITQQVEIYALAVNIALAIGTGSVISLIIAASVYLLDAYLVNKVTSAVTRHVNPKLAAALAVASIAVGVYDSVADAPVSFMPTGKDLLALSTNLTNLAVNTYLKGRMEDLENRYDLLQKEMTSKKEELEAAQAKLDGDLRLDPMIIWGESPDDFYQRTVHSGNIGMVGIDMVSSYVDMKLTLPKLTDTLGDFNG